MSTPPKLKKKIPVLTDVIAKGNRAKEYHSITPQSKNNHKVEKLIDRDTLEALVKPIIEKKLSVYSKLLSAELTRDIVKKLEVGMQDEETENVYKQ